MMLKNQQTRLTQWIEGRCAYGLFVVRVEVDAFVPAEDSSEPCLDSATVRWLEDVQRLADKGDIDALSRVGEVYMRRSA